MLVPLIIIGAVVLCCVLPCVWCCISNCIWKSKKVKELISKSDIAQTARGPVEYSKKGNAPYILALHGTPGTHDGACCWFDNWVENGFGVITPSRPGYGRTPIDHGRTSAEAADTLAALLDTLAIDQVVMFGVSGGGPTAIEFAIRHPDKTKALMTEVAVTGSFTHPKGDQLTGCCCKSLITSPTVPRMTKWMGEKSMASLLKSSMDEMSDFNPEEKE